MLFPEKANATPGGLCLGFLTVICHLIIRVVPVPGSMWGPEGKRRGGDPRDRKAILRGITLRGPQRTKNVFLLLKYHYRVAHLMANLGQVDIDIWCSTCWQVLAGLMGNWQ